MILDLLCESITSLVRCAAIPFSPILGEHDQRRICMHLHFFLILTVEDPDDVKFSTVLDEGKITVFRCRVWPCDITAACPGCFFLQNQTMGALAENDFSSNAIRFDSCTAPSRSAIIQDQNASISRSLQCRLHLFNCSKLDSVEPVSTVLSKSTKEARTHVSSMRQHNIVDYVSGSFSAISCVRVELRCDRCAKFTWNFAC